MILPGSIRTRGGRCGSVEARLVSVSPLQGKGSNVKKFIVTLLMGAFLFTSLAATVGCGDDKPKADKDKVKDKTTPPADKKTDK